MSETEPHASLFEEFSPVDPDDWRNKVREEFGSEAVDDILEWSSLEGITMPAFLHRDDLEDLPQVDSDASVSPLVDATEVPANRWTICQPLHHPDPDQANDHARAAVEGGVRDLRLILSNPCPSSENSGLVLQSLDDLATVLDGIDLNDTGLHLDEGLAAVVGYGALRAYLSRQSVDSATLHGSVGYDPVAALASGEGPSVERLFTLADRLAADAQETPNFRSWTVDARIYHEAGASAVQELACILGTLAERLARHTERGMELNDLSDNLQVIVPVSTSYFVEIAKLRALRLLVPQVIEPFRSETRSAPDFSPTDLYVQAETSRRTETLYDPYANMLRGTTEAMAAVIGNCDVFTVRPYDAALRPPDAFGLRIARNTQLVLRHEAHFDQVADPAAGAYYVERLTDKLAKQAWNQFQNLEARGGIVASLQNGNLQGWIEDTRQQRRDAINEREQVFVGTTHYPALDEKRRNDLAPTDQVPSSAKTEVASLPDSPSIDDIHELLLSGGSPVGVLAELRADSAVEPLPRRRLVADIESIRLRTEEYADIHDGPPRVLLAPIGPPSARSDRATFARNFLGVAGFEIEEPLKFDTVGEAADAAVEQDADAIVLCSSDDEYAELALSLDSALVDRNHDALLLIAGSPDEIDAGGVADVFLYQGCPLQETLETLQAHLGLSVNDGDFVPNDS